MVRFYAGLADRLLAADSTGEVSERLHDHDIECVAASGDRVFVGAFGTGLWRSTDGGATFEQSWPSDAPESVSGLAVSPHDADVVWAGTEPSRVFRSTDGGQSWTERPGLTELQSADSWSYPPRPDTHHVRWIEPDPHQEDRLYVAIEAGALVRTDDGGETWIDRPSGARWDNHTLATHPGAPGRVYTAAGDGYAESHDGGDTWEYPQEGLEHGYLWSVAVDPEDPDNVVLSTASGPNRAHDPHGESVVYARRDGPWERAMDGLPGPSEVARPVLTTGSDGAFYALSNHGLFRSASGREWDRLDVPWDDTYRERVPRGLAVM